MTSLSHAEPVKVLMLDLSGILTALQSRFSSRATSCETALLWMELTRGLGKTGTSFLRFQILPNIFS